MLFDNSPPPIPPPSSALVPAKPPRRCRVGWEFERYQVNSSSGLRMCNYVDERAEFFDNKRCLRDSGGRIVLR